MPGLMDNAGWMPLSRLGQFAQMPELPSGGLMGQPPIPQQAPSPYEALGGWGPAQAPAAPPIPQQMSPEVMAWLMRQQQNPYLSSRIDGNSRSPAGF